jgi:hypothetical protein
MYHLLLSPPSLTPVCFFRAPRLADTTVRGPAALGQLVNAAVVHLDMYMAVLDLVVKVPKM